MRGNDATLDAAVVVPPADDPDALVVDLVHDPAQARRAPAHDRLRAAVLAGRTAARLTRLRDPSQDLTWRTCADQWHDLGDTQRANLARRRGLRDDQPPVPPDALVADELV
jgi:hypothetical protein